MSVVTRLIRSQSFVVVIDQRQSLNMRVERAPQIVHHPLADGGGGNILSVGTKGSYYRDGYGCHGGKPQDRHRIGPGDGKNMLVQPAVLSLLMGPENIVETRFSAARACSRSAQPSPTTANSPTVRAFQYGRKRSPIVSVFKTAGLPPLSFVPPSRLHTLLHL